MKTKIETVSDIPENFTLVTDSQEIDAILESIGHEKDDFPFTYPGCLFVEVLDGEYGDIFYSAYHVPYLSDTVHNLRKLLTE